MLENNKYCNSAAHKHHLQEDRLFKPALSIVFILAFLSFLIHVAPAKVKSREGGGEAGVLFISVYPKKGNE